MITCKWISTSQKGSVSTSSRWCKIRLNWDVCWFQGWCAVLVQTCSRAADQWVRTFDVQLRSLEDGKLCLISSLAILSMTLLLNELKSPLLSSSMKKIGTVERVMAIPSSSILGLHTPAISCASSFLGDDYLNKVHFNEMFQFIDEFLKRFFWLRLR